MPKGDQPQLLIAGTLADAVEDRLVGLFHKLGIERVASLSPRRSTEPWWARGPNCCWPSPISPERHGPWWIEERT